MNADNEIARSIASLPWAELAAPLAKAEDSLARLDERLHNSPIRDGWVARSHFSDACASLWLAGDLITLEDLVLHDANADVRAPTPQLLRAKAIVDTRRQIVAHGPAWALSSGGLEHFLGKEAGALSSAVSSPYEVDLDDPLDRAFADIDAALSRSAKVLADALPAARQAESASIPVGNGLLLKWQRTIDAVSHLPPVLAAGLLWDAWELAPPVSHRAWLGRQLVSAYLVSRDKAQWHFPALNIGLRQSPWERRRSSEKITRLLTWLNAIITGAYEGLREHDRLKIRLALLERKCAQRRSTSRLPELVAMIGAHPLVTVGMVAHKLGVSQRAAQNLIGMLEIREATGRDRYRAWML